LAKFAAVALFGNGPEKRHLIEVLKSGKAEAAAMVMRKFHCAKEPDCYRVCQEICEDLISGMSEDEVAEKDYQFILEVFYYTKREYVPKNDPHWETINVLKFNPETGTYYSEIELLSPKPENS
jgi:hypothetical protein